MGLVPPEAPFCEQVLPLGCSLRPQNGHLGRASGLPSPSRHIYESLTIAVAFRRLSAFDRVWQYPIKVDGTFA
jgi:hypothetical protein